MVIEDADAALADVAVLGARGFDDFAIRTDFETFKLFEQVHQVTTAALRNRRPTGLLRHRYEPWVGVDHDDDHDHDEQLGRCEE